MTRNIVGFIFLLFTSLSFAQTEEDAVKQTFKNYKSSILNDKGKEAVQFLATKTINYYGSLLKKVKEADSLSVNSMNLMDKIFVMRLRYGVSKAEIMSFDARSLVKYAIDEGMIDKNSVIGMELGDVLIDKSFARTELMVNGEKAPFYFHFYKEKGAWKLDLTAIFPIAIKALKQMVENSGQNENELFLELLKYLEPEGPKNNVWNPIKNRAK